MSGSSVAVDHSTGETQPRLHQHGREVQRFDQLRALPLGLPEDVRGEIAALLNQVLSDTRILHDLYKKSHWLMRGATFYQLHLLMDKHAGEQDELVDALAERVQTLGGIAVGDPRHVAELTTLPRPPVGGPSDQRATDLVRRGASRRYAARQRMNVAVLVELR